MKKYGTLPCAFKYLGANILQYGEIYKINNQNSCMYKVQKYNHIARHVTYKQIFQCIKFSIISVNAIFFFSFKILFIYS